MAIQVTGKNIETGAALQDYISDKIDDVLSKYIGSGLGGHVRVEKERGHFRTQCSIRLRTGLLLESHGHGADAYASADVAIERLDKRVRRYKRRLKNHHNGHANGTWPDAQTPEERTADYTIALPDELGDEHSDAHVVASDGAIFNGDPAGEEAKPLIVAETSRALRELSVSAAVMQLDLTDEAFLLFRNSGTGGLNVVYRRQDGNIGWLDPTLVPGSPQPP